ncbi:hypothetical protein JQ038_11050 [Clostridium botulinum]|nr:hypothetical protein [Clostridium botulinum]
MATEGLKPVLLFIQHFFKEHMIKYYMTYAYKIYL